MLWLNQKKAAFNLGFDLDGETIWRNKTKSLPNGSAYLKGPSVGGYGPKKGALHILDILDEYGLKASFYAPALVVEEHAAVVEEILRRGHELGHHGWDHTGNYGATPEEQIATVEKCQELFLRRTGRKAVGCRPTTAELLPETVRWLCTDGGFTYMSMGCSRDYCGFYRIGEEETRAVNIPCRDVQMDDYVQTIYSNYPAVLPGLPRIGSYETVYNNWIRELEGMVRFGNSGSTAFHPQVSGTPGRSMMLRRLCEYLANSPDIWTATCEEIADYYRKVNGGDKHE